MRTLIFFLTCLMAVGPLWAQETFSQTDALKQIYSQYDVQKKTAKWVCIKDQEQSAWPCDKDNEIVYVSVELTAEVQESNKKKLYLVTSAKPIDTEVGDFTGTGYNCHACRVAIGGAVFTWQAQQWVLENANAVTGFYGGWGETPGIKLVQIGPEKHGLLLSVDDLAQGYAWSTKVLLMPLDKTIAEVWIIQDTQDNVGAIDPDDKENQEKTSLPSKIAPSVLDRY